LEELLSFLAAPAAHWKTERTTNVIGRASREVRHRTRPMSSSANLASCDRIVIGVISHLNRSWERKPLKQFTKILDATSLIFHLKNFQLEATFTFVKSSNCPRGRS